MFNLDHPRQSPLFDYFAPTTTEYRGLLSIPHSGETIPKDFLPYLSSNPKIQREDIDFKVNELVDIAKLQESGVGVLVSHVSRICVDLNRAEENTLLFWKKNTQGKDLVIKEPDASTAQDLIENYYRPYYEILKSILENLERVKSGKVSMVDLHSMPSKPTAYHLKQNPNQKTYRPDFCLSDRKGLTCEESFIHFFQKQLIDGGYEATLNDPYVGGYITEYVNHFRTNNIQIEINRGIYMDEVEKELIDQKVKALKPLLTHALIEGFKKFDS